MKPVSYARKKKGSPARALLKTSPTDATKRTAHATTMTPDARTEAARRGAAGAAEQRVAPPVPAPAIPYGEKSARGSALRPDGTRVQLRQAPTPGGYEQRTNGATYQPTTLKPIGITQTPARPKVQGSAARAVAPVAKKPGEFLTPDQARKRQAALRDIFRRQVAAGVDPDVAAEAALAALDSPVAAPAAPPVAPVAAPAPGKAGGMVRETLQKKPGESFYDFRQRQARAPMVAAPAAAPKGAYATYQEQKATKTAVQDVTRRVHGAPPEDQPRILKEVLQTYGVEVSEQPEIKALSESVRLHGEKRIKAEREAATKAAATEREASVKTAKSELDALYGKAASEQDPEIAKQLFQRAQAAETEMIGGNRVGPDDIANLDNRASVVERMRTTAIPGEKPKLTKLGEGDENAIASHFERVMVGPKPFTEPKPMELDKEGPDVYERRLDAWQRRKSEAEALMKRANPILPEKLLGPDRLRGADRDNPILRKTHIKAVQQRLRQGYARASEGLAERHPAATEDDLRRLYLSGARGEYNENELVIEAIKGMGNHWLKQLHDEEPHKAPPEAEPPPTGAQPANPPVPASEAPAVKPEVPAPEAQPTAPTPAETGGAELPPEVRGRVESVRGDQRKTAAVVADYTRT
ncbi:MAG TPA: hypothetical protein VM223_14605, partial [Planctomycetota bacterium]|nr:hypothetical protein [Planctomycetota bacterium]